MQRGINTIFQNLFSFLFFVLHWTTNLRTWVVVTLVVPGWYQPLLCLHLSFHSFYLYLCLYLHPSLYLYLYPGLCLYLWKWDFGAKKEEAVVIAQPLLCLQFQFFLATDSESFSRLQREIQGSTWLGTQWHHETGGKYERNIEQADFFSLARKSTWLYTSRSMVLDSILIHLKVVDGRRPNTLLALWTGGQEGTVS